MILLSLILLLLSLQLWLVGRRLKKIGDVMYMSWEDEQSDHASLYQKIGSLKSHLNKIANIQLLLIPKYIDEEGNPVSLKPTKKPIRKSTRGERW